MGLLYANWSPNGAPVFVQASATEWVAQLTPEFDLVQQFAVPQAKIDAWEVSIDIECRRRFPSNSYSSYSLLPKLPKTTLRLVTYSTGQEYQTGQVATFDSLPVAMNSPDMYVASRFGMPFTLPLRRFVRILLVAKGPVPSGTLFALPVWIRSLDFTANSGLVGLPSGSNDGVAGPLVYPASAQPAFSMYSPSEAWHGNSILAPLDNAAAAVASLQWNGSNAFQAGVKALGGNLGFTLTAKTQSGAAIASVPAFGIGVRLLRPGLKSTTQAWWTSVSDDVVLTRAKVFASATGPSTMQVQVGGSGLQYSLSVQEVEGGIASLKRLRVAFDFVLAAQQQQSYY